MTRPIRANGFFIWLYKNMVRVGILLVLVVGGMIAFAIQDMSRRHGAGEEAREPATPKLTSKDRQRSRYSHGDCDKDPHCRQLKRIYDEGGASEEAIRNNILAADKTVRFEQLQESAARYEGTPWAFEGKIIDIIYQEKRGTGDYILADVIVGVDEGKRVSVKGDFATDFAENDYVYVVGYITGTSHPRPGPNNPKYSGKVPSMSVRALLKPSEAREILNRYGAN
jgi:hypothetical protein